MARLRAAGNGSTQLSDRTYAFVACARNIGLWPHKQNHPPSGWSVCQRLTQGDTGFGIALRAAIE